MGLTFTYAPIHRLYEMMESVSERGKPSDRECNGTAPVTDNDSKSVMLRAERNDHITIVDVVDHFSKGEAIPRDLQVLRRAQPYYGPELLLHTKKGGKDHNYRLTAPGPDTYLYLWSAATDPDGFRNTWYKLAEVQAILPSNQDSYDICSDCGEPIQSLEHERYSAFGRCPGVDT